MGNRPQSTAFELLLSQEVLKLLDNFAAVFDVRVTFFTADGRIIARGHRMRNCRYCSIVQEKLGKLRECLLIDKTKRSEAVAAKNILEYTCHAGLREAVAPVFLHDELAGFLMIGQYRADGTMPDSAMSDCGGILRSELRSAYSELPEIPAKKAANMLGLFKMLLDYIAVRELAVLRGDRMRHDADRWIETHCTEDVHLEDMAAALNRSISTVSQFLRKNYRCGFKDLLTERRLQRAEALWRSDPAATVAEAAKAAGFRDQFYFSRVFRKCRGVPPGEYRRRMFDERDSKFSAEQRQ